MGHLQSWFVDDLFVKEQHVDIDNPGARSIISPYPAKRAFDAQAQIKQLASCQRSFHAHNRV